MNIALYLEKDVWLWKQRSEGCRKRVVTPDVGVAPNPHSELRAAVMCWRRVFCVPGLAQLGAVFCFHVVFL